MLFAECNKWFQWFLQFSMTPVIHSCNSATIVEVAGIAAHMIYRYFGSEKDSRISPLKVLFLEFLSHLSNRSSLMSKGATFRARWHTTFFSALQEREMQGPYLSVSNVVLWIIF